MPLANIKHYESVSGQGITKLKCRKQKMFIVYCALPIHNRTLLQKQGYIEINLSKFSCTCQKIETWIINFEELLIYIMFGIKDPCDRTFLVVPINNLNLEL